MEERRGGRRDRTYLKGVIAFNNRNSTADCLVRDWSIDGARIDVGETLAVPREFDLMVPTRTEDRRSRLVWRRGALLGVKFA